jgi:hypothetical protein
MATISEIKSNNNTLIRVKTTAKSVTKTNVADQLDATIDFTAQEINTVNSALSNKVDKVAGKSLIADTEITRLAGVSNVDVSGKEDISNKSTNVTTDGASDTKYPSVKAVKTYVDANTLPYKVYTAFLQFVDGSTITPTVIHNTIGDGSGDGVNDIAWSYNSGTQPKAVMTDAPFLTDKCVFVPTMYFQSNTAYSLKGIRISDSEFRLFSAQIATSTASLAFASGVFVEIRIYN